MIVNESVLEYVGIFNLDLFEMKFYIISDNIVGLLVLMFYFKFCGMY